MSFVTINQKETKTNIKLETLNKICVVVDFLLFFIFVTQNKSNGLVTSVNHKMFF